MKKINDELRNLCVTYDFILLNNIVIRNGKIVWKHGPHLAEF